MSGNEGVQKWNGEKIIDAGGAHGLEAGTHRSRARNDVGLGLKCCGKARMIDRTQCREMSVADPWF